MYVHHYSYSQPLLDLLLVFSRFSSSQQYSQTPEQHSFLTFGIRWRYIFRTLWFLIPPLSKASSLCTLFNITTNINMFGRIPTLLLMISLGHFFFRIQFREIRSVSTTLALHMSKVKYGFWPSFRPLGLSLPKSALSLVYVYYLAPFNPRTLLSITACQHHIYDVRGNFVILLFKTRAISYKALNSNIPGSD